MPAIRRCTLAITAAHRAAPPDAPAPYHVGTAPVPDRQGN